MPEGALTSFTVCCGTWIIGLIRSFVKCGPWAADLTHPKFWRGATGAYV